MRRSRSVPSLPSARPAREKPAPSRAMTPRESSAASAADGPGAPAGNTLFSRRQGGTKERSSGSNTQTRAASKPRVYTSQSLDTLKARIEQERRGFFSKDPWLAQSLRLATNDLDLSSCHPKVLAMITPSLMKAICVVAALEKRPITSLKLPAGLKSLPDFVKAMGDLERIQILQPSGRPSEVPIASASDVLALADNFPVPVDSGTYINTASRAQPNRSLNLNGTPVSGNPLGKLVCSDLSLLWIRLRQRTSGHRPFGYADLGSTRFLELNSHWISGLVDTDFSEQRVVADALFGECLVDIFSTMERSRENVRHYALQIADHEMALELALWSPAGAKGKVYFRVSFYDPNRSARHLIRWARSGDAVLQWRLGIFQTDERASPWEAYLPPEQQDDRVMLLSQVPVESSSTQHTNAAEIPITQWVPDNFPWAPASIGLLLRANDLTSWHDRLDRIATQHGVILALRTLFARSNGTDAYYNYHHSHATVVAALKLLGSWGLTPGAIAHQLQRGIASGTSKQSTGGACESLLQTSSVPGRALNFWCLHLLHQKDTLGAAPDPDELALLFMPHVLWAARDSEDPSLPPNDAWARLKDAAMSSDWLPGAWLLPSSIDLEQGLVYPPFYSALAQGDAKHIEHLAEVLGTLLQSRLIEAKHLAALLTVQIRMPDGELLDLRAQLVDDEGSAQALAAYQEACERLSQTAQGF